MILNDFITFSRLLWGKLPKDTADLALKHDEKAFENEKKNGNAFQENGKTVFQGHSCIKFKKVYYFSCFV